MEAAEVITAVDETYYEEDYEDPDETGTEKVLDDLANLTNRIYELAKSAINGGFNTAPAQQIATLPESDPARKWMESRLGADPELLSAKRDA